MWNENIDALEKEVRCFHLEKLSNNLVQFRNSNSNTDTNFGPISEMIFLFGCLAPVRLQIFPVNRHEKGLFEFSEYLLLTMSILKHFRDSTLRPPSMYYRLRPVTHIETTFTSVQQLIPQSTTNAKQLIQITKRQSNSYSQNLNLLIKRPVKTIASKTKMLATNGLHKRAQLQQN